MCMESFTEKFVDSVAYVFEWVSILCILFNNFTYKVLIKFDLLFIIAKIEYDSRTYL